jgi:glutamate-1-semialdehyde aminotransferase
MTTAKRLDLTKSHQWKERAARRVPIMSQTFSKSPMCFPQGSYPVFLESGKGGRVTDVDGNSYIDYILALGPVVLGYADPVVDAAVQAQMASGMTFSLPHRLEVEVAELLSEVIPCADMARFSKTGSEATSAAVRVARAFTGRSKVASNSYHGWHDWYAVTTARNVGIPDVLKELIVPFDFNDIASVDAAFKKHPGEIATLILEPATLDEPAPGYLEELMSVAHKNGALVIFDEVVTGFRLATGGAQERYKVTPDLAAFGKAMGNGMPISTVVGRGDVMTKFEDAFFSTTFGGETLSLAATIATINEFRRLNVAEHFWSYGEKLKQAFVKAGEAAGVSVKADGPGPHFLMVIKDDRGEATPEVKSLFLQECVRRGVLFHYGAISLCRAHGADELEETERVMREAFVVVGDAIKRGKINEVLDGPPYREVFRRNR